MFKRLNEIFKNKDKESFSSPDSVASWTLISTLCHPVFTTSQGMRFMYLSVFAVIKTTLKCLEGSILDEYYYNNKISS